MSAPTKADSPIRPAPAATRGTTPQPPLLTGERVVIRGFREDDLPALYELHSDPVAMRHWSFPPWTDIRQAAGYFADALAARDPDRMLCWVITLAGEDRLIGTTTLCSI